MDVRARVGEAMLVCVQLWYSMATAIACNMAVRVQRTSSLHILTAAECVVVQGGRIRLRCWMAAATVMNLCLRRPRVPNCCHVKHAALTSLRFVR